MNIRLPKKTERSIEAAVQRGDFNSVDAALAAAWRSFLKPKANSRPAAGKSLTPDELNRQLIAAGLISQLPNAAEDIDDNDRPVSIKGELLSKTIIRERR